MDAEFNRWWVSREESGNRAPPTHAAGRRLDHGGSGGNRVLVVEDNWLVATETEAVLADAGYFVLGIAVTAAEAVSLCELHRPDFVLMDIRLRGRGDGIDAAIEIRDRFDIPSIFVSAHDDPHTLARAEAARPLGWIVKPTPGGALVDRIESLRRTSQ